MPPLSFDAEGGVTLGVIPPVIRESLLIRGTGKGSVKRFAMPHKVLQRTYSTRVNDFALEFYSFVADNYAPFYSRPVECTDRDAPFVLDGVLYHESDLDLEPRQQNLWVSFGSGRSPSA